MAAQLPAQKQVPSVNAWLAFTLGVLALLLIVAVLAGLNTQLPLVDTDRGAFIALAVLGAAMCSAGGIGTAIAKRGWADPVTIIGSVLGVLMLALIVLALLGVRLPFAATDREAFMALAVLGVVKVLIEAGDHLRK